MEYDAIFDEPYATSIGETYTKTTLILYTKVILIHYQTPFKIDTTWKIHVNNLSVRPLQALLLLSLDKRDDFANKNEEFYNPSIKKILVTINGMSHQVFAAGLQAWKIYPELKKYFYRENSDVTWEDFLTKTFALWIDTSSSMITHSMAVAGQWKKVVYCFRFKKHLKPVVVILHATCLALKMQ